MKKRKNFSSIIFRFLIINILAIGVFLLVKDTKAAADSKVLEGRVHMGGASVVGANISILDSSGNPIQTTTTDTNGYYKIEADIDTTKNYDMKLQVFKIVESWVVSMVRY